MKDEKESRSPSSRNKQTGRAQFHSGQRLKKRQRGAPRKLPTSTASGIRAPKEKSMYLLLPRRTLEK
jgi:hypothetical protein